MPRGEQFSSQGGQRTETLRRLGRDMALGGAGGSSNEPEHEWGEVANVPENARSSCARDVSKSTEALCLAEQVKGGGRVHQPGFPRGVLLASDQFNADLWGVEKANRLDEED